MSSSSVQKVTSLSLLLLFVRGYAVASSSDDRMNEPPTSLGLVPHQVSKLEWNTTVKVSLKSSGLINPCNEQPSSSKKIEKWLKNYRQCDSWLQVKYSE